MFLLLLLAFSQLDAAPAVPENIRATFAETSIDIEWDAVPDAKGYNVYTRDNVTDNNARQKVNPVTIKSGTRFTYIWNINNGMRERKIKGYTHFISITALFDTAESEYESNFSDEISNLYFENFRNADIATNITRILQHKQKSSHLPDYTFINRHQQFVKFMTTKGKEFQTMLNRSIDPLISGSCAPISTIAVKLLQKEGIHAVKAEGTFIREFHAFAIVNIDGSEYILDFAANQFVPGVSPVLIPRDFAFINQKGRLSENGTSVYQVARYYPANGVALAENEEALIFRNLLDSLLLPSHR